MYEPYFTRRLLEALTLADEAADADERSIHLRASRYYREILQSAEKRQSVRHPVRIGAILHYVSPGARPVLVSDLGACGFRMQLSQALRPGRLVALEMEGLALVEAYVVWQEGDQVGCKFLKALHPALLDAALAVSPRVARP